MVGIVVRSVKNEDMDRDATVDFMLVVLWLDVQILNMKRATI